ncbi:MAG: diguanylate cyclase [Pseudomonadota bacterium]
MNCQTDPNKEQALEQAIDSLLTVIISKTPVSLSDNLTQCEKLNCLFNGLMEIRKTILKFANGDLSHKITTRGYISGALKSLQSHLNHLTWQTQMIASGDFSQRVDFMGDFSEAFNLMVAKLEQTIQQLKDREQELSIANQELSRLASLDGLTQLANRRMFDEYLLQVWRLQLRNKSPLSLILCDIDYFKRYNDTYGHQAGDDCLKEVAMKLKESVKRPADLAARYGGEEFVLILPDTNREGAVHVAQRIKGEIKALQIPHANSDVDSHVSLSMGVSSLFPSDLYSAEVLIKTADEALYDVKRKGRNNYFFKEYKY